MPKVIEINKLRESLQEVHWNYDFKIVPHKNGEATLHIPDFILRDLIWAIEDGRPTPLEQVNCISNLEE
jgi:hypothetical protein